MQSLKSNDIPVAIKDDNVEVRTMEVGEMPVGFFRHRPRPGARRSGRRHGPVPSLGLHARGSRPMRTVEGDRIYEAGEAFY